MNDSVNRWYKSDRLGGLRRFATAITLLNIAGHFFLGFEPSWAAPLVAVATAYSLEMLLEFVDARAQGRPVRFAGGVKAFVDFLLPAHISAMAVSMLLYSNQSLGPVMFGAAVAIASKAFFRARVDGSERHIFNPSNFGIACTLLCFHWVGIAPPYMFTENLGTVGDLILPSVVIVLGTLLNTKFTRRLPLIAAWLSTFVLQGATRHFLLGQPFVSTLLPMTGLAFLLFTFYMVTDPPTTPSSTRGQILFGASVAIVYGLLMVLHVVFGLFFSLAITSTVRAVWLWTRPARATVPPARESGAALAEVTLTAQARVASKKPLPAHSPEVVRES
jgi:enediyne biosynthesis protein E5